MCVYCNFDGLENWGDSIHCIGAEDFRLTLSGDGVGKFRGFTEEIYIKGDFNFNYCPMCGRKLSGDVEGEDKPHYKPEETYTIFTETSCGAESVVFSWKDVLDYVQEVMDNGADDYVEVFQKVAEARLRRSMDWV